MLALLEMAVRLEAQLCDAQLNGEIDPILGWVVPVGSYLTSPSHLFHTSLRLPVPIQSPIPIQTIEDEDMEEDLSDIEEQWLIDVGLAPPPPPSPVVQPLFVPEYGHDWPDAIALDGPNGIVIGSEAGSTDTNTDIGDWRDMGVEDLSPRHTGMWIWLMVFFNYPTWGEWASTFYLVFFFLCYVSVSYKPHQE